MASLFGISFFTGTERDLYNELALAASLHKSITIATVNPEILLRASRDVQFARALSQADFRVVDGFGISLVSLLRRGKRIRRITGRAIVEILFHLAAEKHLRIGVIGGGGQTAKRAADLFSSRYERVPVFDMSRGSDIRVSDLGEITKGIEVIAQSTEEYAVDILLLGFGAPKQEYIMQQENVLFAQFRVGIGGLIDVYGGNLKAPPVFFVRVGLEWLYRLWQEPHRFTRIWNAVIVFTIKALITKQA